MARSKGSSKEFGNLETAGNSFSSWLNAIQASNQDWVPGCRLWPQQQRQRYQHWVMNQQAGAHALSLTNCRHCAKHFKNSKWGNKRYQPSNYRKHFNTISLFIFLIFKTMYRHTNKWQWCWGCWWWNRRNGRKKRVQTARCRLRWAAWNSSAAAWSASTPLGAQLPPHALTAETPTAAGFFLVNCKLRSLTKCPKTIDIWHCFIIWTVTCFL